MIALFFGLVILGILVAGIGIQGERPLRALAILAAVFGGALLLGVALSRSDDGRRCLGCDTGTTVENAPVG